MKVRPWLHDLEKRALVGESAAILSLVSAFRAWRDVGDRMLEDNFPWCEPLKAFADRIEGVEHTYRPEGAP